MNNQNFHYDTNAKRINATYISDDRKLTIITGWSLKDEAYSRMGRFSVERQAEYVRLQLTMGFQTTKSQVLDLAIPLLKAAQALLLEKVTEDEVAAKVASLEAKEASAPFTPFALLPAPKKEPEQEIIAQAPDLLPLIDVATFSAGLKSLEKSEEVVGDGDIERVRQYVATLTEGSKKEPSLIAVAARYGHTAIVSLLIDQGWNDPKTKNRALWAALDARELETARLLIARGADVNSSEWQLLYRAMNDGHLPVVKLLVAAGADTTKCGRYMNLERSDIVEFLVDHGADVRQDDDYQLRRACMFGNVANMEFLYRMYSGQAAFSSIVVEHGDDTAKNWLRTAQFIEKLERELPKKPVAESRKLKI
ncbi:Ankyrin repeats (3 copies) [Caballeronia peredens]|nr:Ankyrin repeats (3 copies) [Caballeronia peredens]